MGEELDLVDKRMLDMLQDDARIPMARLAKELKIGETTVRYRLRRLVKRGVISRFTALLNPRKVGLTVIAIILIKADAKRLEEVFQELAGYDETQHIFQTTGEHDMVTVVHTKDNQHLNELVARVKGVEGVRDALLWVATGLIKIDPRLKLP